MVCERYKKALIEAASGSELPNAARSHVDACSDCRAWFASQQALRAAVDALLRQKTNADVPPGFLTRVMTRVTGEAIAEPRWSPAWTAIAAFAVLAIAIGLAWNFRHGTVVQDSTQPIVASGSLPPNHESAATAGSLADGVPSKHVKPIARQKARHIAHENEPEVLVSAETRAATDQLIENIRRGKIDGQVLISGTVEELAISPIVIKPIVPDSESGEPPDSSGLPSNTEYSQGANRRTQ